MRFAVSGFLILVTCCGGEGTGGGTTEEATVVSSLTSDFTPPTGAAAGPGEAGPWNNRLMIATSTDGLNFTRKNVVVTDQGDVPDLVIAPSGRLFLYYTGWTIGTEVNKIVVAVSDDSGTTWAYKRVSISGFQGYAEPVDPDVQLLSDGTFRLFVTSDPGDGQGPRTYCTTSSDGFTFSKVGVAFAQPGKQVLDPTTYYANGTWHLYAGGSTSTALANWHATSADGITFTYSDERLFTTSGGNCAVANAVAVSAGWRFYAFTHSTSPSIVSFFSTDGWTWSSESGTRLALDTSAGLESNGVKDPAVVRLADGTWFMIYVSRIP